MSSFYTNPLHSDTTKMEKDVFVKNLNDKEVKKGVLDLKTSLPIENPNIGARKVTTFLTELLIKMIDV